MRLGSAFWRVNPQGRRIRPLLVRNVEAENAVVRQLVGTTLGVLRHLVWTMVAPVERDHLVGVFRGRCRGR